MKTLLLIAMFLIGPLYGSFAQTNDWTLYEEKDGVKISWKYADCDLEMGYDERRVLLRFENTNSYNVNFTYEAQLHYNGDCLTCNDPNGEYRHDLEMSQGEILEGECSVYSPGSKQFFVRWVSQPNSTELTKFELANITVQKL